jgi:hypothetical protein
MKHVFDQPWVPVTASLLVGQALAYDALVPFPRSWAFARLAILSILLGAAGIAPILLLRRWPSLWVFSLGVLGVLVPIALGLIASGAESLRPFTGYVIHIGMILTFGAIGAGWWHFFQGPFILDKSQEPAQLGIKFEVQHGLVAEQVTGFLRSEVVEALSRPATVEACGADGTHSPIPASPV